MGKDVLFDFGMCFGEGIGVVLVIGVVKVVVEVYLGMVIFVDVGVVGKLD